MSSTCHPPSTGSIRNVPAHAICQFITQWLMRHEPPSVPGPSNRYCQKRWQAPRGSCKLDQCTCSWQFLTGGKRWLFSIHRWTRSIWIYHQAIFYHLSCWRIIVSEISHIPPFFLENKQPNPKMPWVVRAPCDCSLVITYWFDNGFKDFIGMLLGPHGPSIWDGCARGSWFNFNLKRLRENPSQEDCLHSWDVYSNGDTLLSHAHVSYSWLNFGARTYFIIICTCT